MPGNEKEEFFGDQVPILTCKVVGVTFENRQQILKRLLKGQDMRGVPVHLTPEPENPYDSNAVKVLVMGEHIGYVPREAAEDVLRALELGMIHERQRANLGCTAKKNGGFIYWASLAVYKTAVAERKEKKEKASVGRPRRKIDLIDLGD